MAKVGTGWKLALPALFGLGKQMTTRNRHVLARIPKICYFLSKKHSNSRSSRYRMQTFHATISPPVTASPKFTLPLFPQVQNEYLSASRNVYLLQKKQTATFNERQTGQFKNVLGTVHKGGGQKRDKCLNHSE